MGLFVGFSFISIAEFVYYAILRPYHAIKRHERVFIKTEHVGQKRSLQPSPSVNYQKPPTTNVVSTDLNSSYKKYAPQFGIKSSKLRVDFE